jgi:hypothetical protein
LQLLHTKPHRHASQPVPREHYPVFSVSSAGTARGWIGLFTLFLATCEPLEASLFSILGGEYEKEYRKKQH